MTTQLKEGKVLPKITLPDEDGQKTDIARHRGRWIVLYFYPKDDTPGCTTEACEFSSNLKEFGKLNAKVFGISPDSPLSHQKFIKKHKLIIKLLSDEDHKVADKFGAWGIKKMYGKEYEGIIRSTLLVNPEGRIAYHWPKVSPAGHAKEVAEKIKELS